MVNTAATTAHPPAWPMPTAAGPQPAVALAASTELPDSDNDDSGEMTASVASALPAPPAHKKAVPPSGPANASRATALAPFPFRPQHKGGGSASALNHLDE
jgi:hypothetical protein